MRILILASDTFASCYYLCKILEKYHDNIIEIVCTYRPLAKKRGKWLRRKFSESGFRYFFVRAVMRLTLGFCDRIYSKLGIMKFFKLSRMARTLGIKISYCSNFNSLEFINKFSANRPDYLISCCIAQKLKADVLRLAKKNPINVHAAPLPKYGGIAPTVWAMANKEKEVAVTIHIMHEDLDTGDILLQEYMPMKKGQSLFSLGLQQVIVGQRLFLEALERLEERTIKPKKQDLSKKSYFSHPGPAQIKQLREAGFSLLRFRDVINWIKSAPCFPDTGYDLRA